MRKYELRTYRLRTPEAAAIYLPHWVLHVESLKLFGVETHAFFSVPFAPQTFVALISFDEHADPEAVTRDYMQAVLSRKTCVGSTWRKSRESTHFCWSLERALLSHNSFRIERPYI